MVEQIECFVDMKGILSKRDLWILGCFLLIAIAYFVINKLQSLDTNESIEERVRIDGNLTRDELKKLQKVIEKSGFDSRKTEELLIILLGPNYKEVITNEETYNQLISQLAEKSLLEIIKENQSLKDKVGEFQFFGSEGFREKITDLISKLQYNSAREEIDNFIKEYPELKAEYLAQLYSLKAVTYSGKDLNHDKRRENIEKAFELDNSNPEILQLYAKFLSYNEKYEQAINLLIKAIRIINKGEAKPFTVVQIYTTIGWATFKVEMNKLRLERDFTGAKDYLLNAIIENKKLTANQSQLHVILRYLAPIEAEQGNYTTAIKLLEESIQTEKELIGDRFSIDTAYSYYYLGMCFTYQYNKEEIEQVYLNGVNAYSKSLKMFQLLAGNNHTSVADVYAGWAILEKKRNNLDFAIDLSLNSIEITQAYTIPHPEKLAAASANLARIYTQKGMRNEALKYAFMALTEFRKFLPEDHEEINLIKLLINHLQNIP